MRLTALDAVLNVDPSVLKDYLDAKKASNAGAKGTKGKSDGKTSNSDSHDLTALERA